jgi:hypothetical protein
MSISIHEVSDRRQLNQFVDLPWQIYRQDKNWVPPLKMSVKALFSNKHPFYTSSQMKNFVAEIDGKVMARISAIVNHTHNQFHAEKCGFWGFFECHPDHPELAEKLFSQAEGWLKSQGMETIRGPISPSTNYECGLLIEGFDDPPQLMMTYNPKSYQTMIEKLGYTKAMDLLAYNMPLNLPMSERIVRIAKKCEQSANITYRRIDMKQWDKEIRIMLDIYNNAWEKNWGFVPMSSEEFLHTANDLKMVVRPEMILFAMVKGEPAGFIVSLPDFNQIFKKIPSGNLFPFGIFKLLTGKKKINRVRTLTMGVKRQFQHLGLGSLLYQKAQKDLLDLKQFDEVEMSWILENNIPMNKALILMGAKIYKRYRLFEKKL